MKTKMPKNPDLEKIVLQAEEDIIRWENWSYYFRKQNPELALRIKVIANALSRLRDFITIHA